MLVNASEITIDQIDLENECYRTRFVSPVADQVFSDLVHSVSSYGVLNPPLIAVDSGAYVVVSGLRRIQAAIKCGLKKVLCHVLDDSRLNLYKIAINENLYSAPYTELDKALMVSRIKDLSGSQITKELVRILGDIPGLRINEDYAKRLLVLNDLPVQIKSAVSKGHISPAIAMEYDLKDDPCFDRILFLLESLKMGLNLQREFFNLVYEIAKIRKTRISDVLSDAFLAEVISNEADPSKRRDKLLCELKRIRFPHIEKSNQLFEGVAMRLTVKDSGISIIRSKSFESREVSFSFTVNSRVKFREMLSELEKIYYNKGLDAIFSINLNQ